MSLYTRITTILTIIGVTIFLAEKLLHVNIRTHMARRIDHLTGKDRKKLEKLVAYLRKHLGDPRPDRLLPTELLDRLQSDPSDANLTALAQYILSQAGWSQTLVTAGFAGTDKQVAGTFGACEIVVDIGKMSSVNDICAVLVHECMHFFCGVQGLGKYRTVDNEWLTDIATIYMGWGAYTEAACDHIGYLGPEGVQYVRELLTGEV